MGVILRAHSVRGEQRIQCNANREVATLQALPIFQHTRQRKIQIFFLGFSLFMHPDQAHNTQSGMQGQEATALAII